MSRVEELNQYIQELFDYWDGKNDDFEPIHVVDGKKMVRTIGDLYLSGESEHVQFEQL